MIFGSKLRSHRHVHPTAFCGKVTPVGCAAKHKCERSNSSMAKKKRKRTKHVSPENDLAPVYATQYEITDEPIQVKW
jgi:hypothetical protein